MAPHKGTGGDRMTPGSSVPGSPRFRTPYVTTIDRDRRRAQGIFGDRHRRGHFCVTQACKRAGDDRLFAGPAFTAAA